MKHKHILVVQIKAIRFLNSNRYRSSIGKFSTLTDRSCILRERSFVNNNDATAVYPL